MRTLDLTQVDMHQSFDLIWFANVSCLCESKWKEMLNIWWYDLFSILVVKSKEKGPDLKKYRLRYEKDYVFIYLFIYFIWSI